MAGHPEPETEDCGGFIRFLGWRPVGSAPIHGPSRTRKLFINLTERREGQLRDHGKSFISGAYAPILRNAYVEARYDGFYVCDLEIDQAAFDSYAKTIKPPKPTGQNSLNADARSILRSELAREVGMAIKEELDHIHYFHAAEHFNKPKLTEWVDDQLAMRRSRESTNTLIRWALEGLGFVLTPVRLYEVFAERWNRWVEEYWPHHFRRLTRWVEPFLLAMIVLASLQWWLPNTGNAGVVVTSVFWVYPAVILTKRLLDWLLGRYELSPDTLLRTGPVIIERSTTEPPQQKQRLPRSRVEDPDWIWSQQSRPPADDRLGRSALGQMRRDFLKIVEKIDAALGTSRKPDKVINGIVAQLFWLLWTFLVVLAVMVYLYPTSGMMILLVMCFLVLFGSSVLGLVAIILRLDLPRIKLLRAAEGFFEASNPVNKVINQISAEAKRSANKMPVDDFSAVIGAFRVKVEGESQRLQIKQFWAASGAAVIGALVTALAILVGARPLETGPAISHLLPMGQNGYRWFEHVDAGRLGIPETEEVIGPIGGDHSAAPPN